MANETRRFANLCGGRVEDNNALTAGGTGMTGAATTLTSAGLAAMPVIGSTEHIVVVFDPDGLTGTPFAKRCTAHTSAATTCTIETAATTFEGLGSARDVPRGTPWVAGSIAKEDLRDTYFKRLVYSTSSKKDVTGTLADFDSTNLVITFTAPPSGSVEIKLCSGSGSTASSSVWGLREGTTQVGNLQYVHGAVVTRGVAFVTVTGLTPGTSYTYKWAGKNTGAGTSSLYIGGNSGIDGDAIMEVVPLP